MRPSSLDDLLSEFPEPVREMVKQIWATLPLDQQHELERLPAMLPKDWKPMKALISLIIANFADAMRESKERVAIVGPANTGKSTLYNHFIVRPEDRAEVDPRPGTTRVNQAADACVFDVVDTPGVDAIGPVGESERNFAFDAARAANFLIILFDANHGIGRNEQILFTDLRGLNKPYVVALNKIDLIGRRNRDDVVNSAADRLHLDHEEVTGVSAATGEGLGDLVLAIAKAQPALLKTLGLVLPQYRARLAWERTIAAASMAAGVGALPIPFADVIPLLAIETGLVLVIARIYGFDIAPGRAKEILATFGIGFAARTLFQELSKLGGLPGWLLSVVISASTTVAIGIGAMTWFARGERPTQAVLAGITREVTEYLKEELGDLRERKPGEGTLRERVARALDNLPDRLRPDRLAISSPSAMQETPAGDWPAEHPAESALQKAPDK